MKVDESKSMFSGDDVLILTKGLERLTLTRSSASASCSTATLLSPAAPKSFLLLVSPEEEKMFTTIQSLRSHALAPHKIYEFIRSCIDEQLAGEAPGYSKVALIKFFRKCREQGFNFALIQNERGETVMHVAADQGDPYVLMLFVQAGSSSYPLTKHKGTPLHFAAFCAREKTVRFLVQAALREGHNIDHPDDFGMTALHWLTYSTYPPRERIRLDGSRESMVAEIQKIKEAEDKVVAILLDAKAHVAATDALRRTPLHWAACNGKEVIVDGLLKHLTDEQFLVLMAMQDKDRQTPLDGAVFFRRQGVINIFWVKLLEFLKTFHGFNDPQLLIIISYI